MENEFEFNGEEHTEQEKEYLAPGEIASLLDVTPQRIVAWRQQGCPSHESGRLCLEDVQDWLEKNEIVLSETPKENIEGLLPDQLPPDKSDNHVPVCQIHYVRMTCHSTKSTHRRYYCPVETCEESDTKLRDIAVEAVPIKPTLCRCGKAAVNDPTSTTVSTIVLRCATGACTYKVNLSRPARSVRNLRIQKSPTDILDI